MDENNTALNIHERRELYIYHQIFAALIKRGFLDHNEDGDQCLFCDAYFDDSDLQDDGYNQHGDNCIIAKIEVWFTDIEWGK